MECQTPKSCPYTVTVRRNPHRRARVTPAVTDHQPQSAIRSFPTDEIIAIDVPKNDHHDLCKSSDVVETPENLKVFLRIRPLAPPHSPASKVGNGTQSRISREKVAWPQNRATKKGSKETKKLKKDAICIKINDNQSVTLTPPQALQDIKRAKSEDFGGFSHVFSAESSQDEVYEKMVNPLVEDFLRGKSGLLAALGPSGSGKTHTMFGTTRDPGMLPLVLRKIFQENQEGESKSSRPLYISMFEISSEGGKADRLLDLSSGCAELIMQQTTIKGLQEVNITELAQAEAYIAHGMLKRATSATCLNSLSSRSQCIINIRIAGKKIGEEFRQKDAALTIVDLAGSEKEKKTGHQGARLRESNFINNTSMVLGLCLRSLLEHQKNPKKPLQKHYQSSLLTRYLRDYLEGKKRMALILTVKPGEEDYLDTSFLLRQASPYMNIKFVNNNEQHNLLRNKRNASAFPRAEHLKRVKSSEGHASLPVQEEGSILSDGSQSCEGNKSVIETEASKATVQSPELVDMKVVDSASQGAACLTCKERERSSHIMQNFAKALWNVLKQYKEKLELAESEVKGLQESARKEKKQIFELQRELRAMKVSSSYKDAPPEESLSCGLPDGGLGSPNIDEVCMEKFDLNSGHTSSDVDQSARTTSSANQSARTTSSVDHSARTTSSVDQSARVTSSVEQSARSTSFVEQSAGSTSSVEQSARITSSVEQSARSSSSVELSARPTTSVEQSTRSTSSVEQSARATSSVEQSLRTSIHKHDNDADSRFVGSPCHKGHDSTNSKVNAEEKDLNYKQFSARMPITLLSSSSEAGVCTPESKRHGSAEVHVLNADLKSLKSEQSSFVALPPIVSPNSTSYIRFSELPKRKRDGSGNILELNADPISDDSSHEELPEEIATINVGDSFRETCNSPKPECDSANIQELNVDPICDESSHEELADEIATVDAGGRFGKVCHSPKFRECDSTNVHELNVDRICDESSDEELAEEIATVDAGGRFGKACHSPKFRECDSANVQEINVDSICDESSHEELAEEIATFDAGGRFGKACHSPKFRECDSINVQELNVDPICDESEHEELAEEIATVDAGGRFGKACHSPKFRECDSINVQELNVDPICDESSHEELAEEIATFDAGGRFGMCGSANIQELNVDTICDESSHEKLVEKIATVDVGKACHSPKFRECDSANFQEETVIKQVQPKELKQRVGNIHDCNIIAAQENEPKCNASSNTRIVEKPKRRLLPASSILLRDMNSLLEDETRKLKGNRGEKKLVDDQKRTQGSRSLLQLLQGNVQH